MDSPDKWLYEYSTVRFVPRIDRGEFINIGLVMMNKRCKWLKGEILIDESRLKAFYPGIDPAALRNQSSLFRRDDVPSKDIPVEERYRWLTAVKSAMLQVSPSHPGIVSPELVKMDRNASHDEIMEAEFKRLLSELVKV